MSSEDESIQAVITLLSYVPSGDRFDIACAALVVYEYILTFPQELHAIWGHKLRGAAVLFILNRYITVVYAILILILYLVTWRASCSALGYTIEVISCIQFLILGAFSALRVYAIGASGWWAASVAILMGIAPVAIYIYLDVISYFTYFPFIGCVAEVYDSNLKAIFMKSFIISRACAILSGCIILGLTWYKTYGIRLAAKKVNMKTSLTTLILRDGTIYFLVILILNAVAIGMFYVTQFMSVTVLLYPLSSILMSRFVLNLRQFNQMDPIDNIQSLDIASPEIGSSVRFTSSIIAGMGAPLSNDSYLTTGLDDGNGDDLYTTMAVPESVIGYVPVGRGSLDEESPRPPS